MNTPDSDRWCSVVTASIKLARVKSIAAMVFLVGAQNVPADDDAYVVTPPGFTQPGVAKTASGSNAGRLDITVQINRTGQLTPCRLNVVGLDGNFYQPAPDRLSPYSSMEQWPKTGKGNSQRKGPIRYLGRFFYTTGHTALTVPAGLVRIEAWKGLEYRPVTQDITVTAAGTTRVVLKLERTVLMSELGYYSGDPHLHVLRKTEAGGEAILSVLEAEDIHFGGILAQNEAAGTYAGEMRAIGAPQLLGFGKTLRRRGETWIASGQEYCSKTYGHLNLFGRDDLALAGQTVNADNWPLLGVIGRETSQRSGFAIFAGDGFAPSIYADFVQQNINAIELLQSGVYRGIELTDWYDILSIGYRFPCLGGSNFPACGKLGDCLTYVSAKDSLNFPDWLGGAAEGRSFTTTGPLLVLQVDGQQPGGTILKTGSGPHSVRVRVRATSEVAPLQIVQLIVNGSIVREQGIPSDASQRQWVEVDQTVTLSGPAWIAARVFGRAPSGSPDAEAHSNPVYVYVDGKAPYNRGSLDRLVARIDQQMMLHRKRTFAEKARVLDYFQRSRDLLLRIRQAAGLPASGVPAHWFEEEAEAIDASRRTHGDSELARFLQPLPATSPDEALKTFETAEGFHVELVACEPLVESPVAASFDADGNLYVAEMWDYPFKPRPGHKPLGSLRLLRDTDGDGRFDRSSIFADGLLWAAGIAPWRGGVYVTAPPDLWYLKDTDGDGKADVRQRVYTGFGTGNQQAMVNNLIWGLDHKIYGAAAGNGGLIRPVGNLPSTAISVDRSDFRFDPITGAFELVTGTRQFGNTFDDWGNRFVCTQDSPFLHPILPRRDMARNPFHLISESIHNMAGPEAPIFRLSPVERWRQIRSSRRIAHGERAASSSGASHHVVDAAAGVTIYRGSAYPAEFYGNAFVGDAQNNLVHRRLLVPDGPTFRAERDTREQQTEFVRSPDNWFRPVNFVNAPDGTLYVLDMSRAVIEAIHIPLDVMKHLDLKRGRNQGRIYRIAPQGFQFHSPPRLSQAKTLDLVSALKRLDGWHRDTAHRLLFERRDSTAIEPLHQMLRPNEAPLPQTRINAIWSLEGLNALRDEDIVLVLADPVPQVRAQALQLASQRLSHSASLLAKVLTLAHDVDSRVRFQVALALGAASAPQIERALLQIAKTDAANPWIRAAVLSSCTTVADQLLLDLWTDQAPAVSVNGTGQGKLLEQLAETVGARARFEEVDHILRQLAQSPGDGSCLGVRNRLVLALARGLHSSSGSLPREATQSSGYNRLVTALVESTMATALNGRASDSARVEAIASISTLEPATLRAALVNLLEPHQPLAVQTAAVRSVAGDRAPEVAEILIARLGSLEPSVRQAAVSTLLSRASWTRVLLQAINNKDPATGISAALLELSDRTLLLSHRDPEIARLAQAVLGQTDVHSRRGVLDDYVAVLHIKGDPARGARVFERECKSCHKVSGQGFALGPDLTGSPSNDALALLANILDPNLNVLPSYVQYMVLDRDGRAYSGIVASQSATSLTLQRIGGLQDTVLRSQIMEVSSTGRSLMPEGFEKTISKREMADLLSFLQASRRTGDQGMASDPGRVQPLDIGTLPGLIEPDE
jgi:putative membrane-bound dehydrogenase-like protein